MSANQDHSHCNMKTSTIHFKRFNPPPPSLTPRTHSHWQEIMACRGGMHCRSAPAPKRFKTRAPVDPRGRTRACRERQKRNGGTAHKQNANV